MYVHTYEYTHTYINICICTYMYMEVNKYLCINFSSMSIGESMQFDTENHETDENSAECHCILFSSIS
jgi:hypothetical protein